MTDTIQHRLSRMSVTLACEPDAEVQGLLRHLQRTRATVRHMWPVPESFGEDTDIVICGFMPGLSRKLAWMAGDPKAALIVLLSQQGKHDLQELRSALPDAVLYRPFLPHAIDTALMLALDHFSYGRRTRMRIARLDENLHALRDIEKAKHEIMRQQKLSESDAYRVLRDMAMERRVTIAELASRMVDSTSPML